VDTMPAGYNKKREGVAMGKLERQEYDATAVAPGLKRWMDVWLPADYDSTKKYPVVYALHGIGGNEKHEWLGKGNKTAEWIDRSIDQGSADIILDNLLADKKIVPMIVVFPNGNASAGGGGGGAAPGGGGRGGGRRGGGAPGGPPGGAPGAAPGAAPGGAMGPMFDEQMFFVGAPAAPASGPATAGAPGGRGAGRGGAGGGRWGGGGIGGAGWGNFTNDLIKDIIPFMESHYSVYTDKDHRAICGLSMGGGQTVNIGLANLDTFSWVGAFSQAPNSGSVASLVPDADAVNKKLKLLWIGVGDNDQTVGTGPYNFHKDLLAKNVKHIWHVDVGGHSMPVWEENLYLFTQKLFREPAKP